MEELPVNEPEPTPEQEPQVRPLRIKRRKPIVTWILIGISVLVYGLQLWTKQKYGADIPLQYGAKFAPLIRYYHQYWRLIAPIFIHGGNMHLLVNMYSLYNIGRGLESEYGHISFLFFYLISGAGGFVLSYLKSPESVSVGASTAIFGLVAAEAFFILKNQRILSNPKGALRSVLSVILLNLLIGMNSGIDNWGHLGGLITGAIMAYAAGPILALKLDADSGLSLADSVPVRTRVITYTLTALLLAAMVYAL